MTVYDSEFRRWRDEIGRGEVTLGFIIFQEIDKDKSVSKIPLNTTTHWMNCKDTELILNFSDADLRG